MQSLHEFAFIAHRNGWIWRKTFGRRIFESQRIKNVTGLPCPERKLTFISFWLQAVTSHYFNFHDWHLSKSISSLKTILNILVSCLASILCSISRPNALLLDGFSFALQKDVCNNEGGKKEHIYYSMTDTHDSWIPESVLQSITRSDPDRGICGGKKKEHWLNKLVWEEKMVLLHVL